MTLKEWLHSRNMRQARFCELSGLRAPMVSKLCSEKRRPRVSVDVIHKVFEATGGQVTADDVLGLKLSPDFIERPQAAE